MKAPVYVWPRRSVLGWTEGPLAAPRGDSKREKAVVDVDVFEPVDLLDALREAYHTDAHFVPYVVVDAQGRPTPAPRVKKASSGPMQQAGVRRLMTAIVLDVDDPVTHKTTGIARPEWLEQQIESFCDLPLPLFRGHGWYATTGGYRLLWQLDPWLSVEAFVDLHAALRAELAEHGIAADRLIDAERCYRLPDVWRGKQNDDGTWTNWHQAFRGDLDSLGPLTWRPARPAVGDGMFAGLAQAKTFGQRAELPEVIEDNRNSTLLSLAGRLRNAGLNEQEILASVRATNHARCSPPLDDDEVQEICGKYAGQAPRSVESAPFAGALSPAVLSPQLAAALGHDRPVPKSTPTPTDAEMPESPGQAPDETLLQRLREHALAVVSESRRDPGAAFTDLAIETAAILRDQDASAFARMRNDLKGSVSISEWLKLIRRASKARARAETQQRVSQARFALGSENEIATALCEDFERGTEPLVYDRGEMWRYNEQSGLWDMVPSDVLERHVAAYDGQEVVVGHAEGAPKIAPLKVGQRLVTNVRQLASTLRTQRDFFDGAPVGVAFRNGFLELIDGEVKPSILTPEHRVTWTMPLIYDPQARAPRFERYLQEVFAPDGPDEAAAKTRLLAQFFGAALFGLGPRYKKTLMLHGPTADNGKSVLLEVISALYPADARCSVPPQDMAHGPQGALLAGRRINIVDEMPDGEVMRGEAFKAIVTGGEITRDRKYKDPITFKPVAAHVFSANKLPGSSDKSDGFFTRWLVVDFRRKFRRSEMEFGLAQKIIDTELAGIAAWCVRGAVDLLRAGDYTLPESSYEALDEWRKRVDPLVLFLDECTDVVDNAWNSSKDLFAAYQSWCKQGDYRYTLTAHAFGQRLVELGVPRKRSDGTRFHLQLRERSRWGMARDAESAETLH